MKVLVLCGDLWHPGEVVRMGLSPLASGGFDFTFVEDAKDILYADMLREYPVILNCKGDQLNGANTSPWFEKGVTEVDASVLRGYVEKGGGFVSLHAGNAFMRDGDADYLDMLGACFVTHPPRCDVQVQLVKEGPVHPVIQGVRDFTARDEHYELDVWAKDITLLFHTVSETGGKQVGGYVRALGMGRLCVLTPGHILQVWRNPDFMRLLENALRWSAEGGGEG